MSRVPVVSGDTNAWGSILNDYLAQQHGSTGGHYDIKAVINAAVWPLWTVGPVRFDASSANTYWVYGDNTTPSTSPNNMILVRGSFTGSASGTANLFLDSTIYGSTDGDIYGLVAGSAYVRQSAGGTHTNIFGHYVLTPTSLGGTDTVTNCASLRIQGASTFATNNYALWIGSGTIQNESGNLVLTAGTARFTNNASFTLNAPEIGQSGGKLTFVSGTNGAQWLSANGGTVQASLSSGWTIGSPTGGDKGLGTINVSTSGGYYAGGSSGVTKTGVTSTFTGLNIVNGIITAITT